MLSVFTRVSGSSGSIKIDDCEVVKTYRTQGLAALLEWNYHGGRRSKLSDAIVDALQKRLSDPTTGFNSYKEVKHWLFEEQGLKMPYSTVHRIVHYKLQAKLLEIIGILQNIEGSPALPLRYWSQDESRVGLKTITRSVLTALGVKPIGPIQWNYQSFYLYGGSSRVLVELNTGMYHLSTLNSL
jgi:hypothetical protein